MSTASTHEHDLAVQASTSWRGLLAKKATPIPAPNPRLLLIDPDPSGHELLTCVAEALGTELDIAKDRFEAISLAIEHAYDVIIVATSTPQPDSAHELVSRLRTLQHGSAFLLARARSNEPWFMPRFADYGIAGLVTKPWEEEELKNALELGLQLRAARQAQMLRTLAERHVLAVGSARDITRVQTLLSQTDPGFVVDGARSIGDALELLRRNAYDVVITEVVLPDACGLDAVTTLCRACQDQPVLVLTALNDENLSAQGLGQGAQDFLVKQLTSADLLSRAIRHAISRQRIRGELHQQARRDPLTKLANRRSLEDQLIKTLARATRREEQFAVLYIDLDDFKTVNDEFGHDTGDAVLAKVSERLQAAVREYDTVARLGGDEFVIILDTLDSDDEAGVVAERVLRAVARPMRLQRREIRVTASIGVSVFPAAAKQISELLRAADRAMYRAKRTKNAFESFRAE